VNVVLQFGPDPGSTYHSSSNYCDYDDDDDDDDGSSMIMMVV